MKTAKPIDAILQLTEGINKGDVENAVAAYEPGASLVAQPGQVVTGTQALRQALAGFIALKPILTTEMYKLIESGDIALYLSRWKLTGKDPQGKEVKMAGTSSDILRRQPDGRWLIALDNPWGAALLIE